MTNYSILFLAVACIAGSLCGLNNVLLVAPNVDVSVDNVRRRRRLLHDPRTVIRKTPHNPSLQSGSQVREAEDETTDLVGRQKEGGDMPQQQGMVTLPSMSQQQSQQLQQVENAPQAQQRSSDKKNLEFIHISKTGGSAIAAAAAKHNIMWSECHYWKIPRLGCTTPDWEFPEKKCVERMPVGLVYEGYPWHAPPHWNVPNMLEGSDTFVVVRNPYERIVSEYYCSAFGYRGDDRENPENFNEWLGGKLTLLGEKLWTQGHMLPQNYYVYDENGNELVTHILRYENLHSGFDALMKRCNLPVRLPAKSAESVFHYEANDGKETEETITVNSISPENIDGINQLYSRDFELFGYPKISS